MDCQTPYTGAWVNYKLTYGSGELKNEMQSCRVFTIYWRGNPNKLKLPHTHGGSTHNLALIDQALWKKIFELVEDGLPDSGHWSMGIL